MSQVINLLSSQSTKFEDGPGYWEVSAGAQVSVTRQVVRPESASASLKIFSPSGSSASAVAEVEQIPQPSETFGGYGGFPIRGFAWVNSDFSGDVTIYLTYLDGGASFTFSSVTSVLANEWTLLSADIEALPSNATAILLTVSSSFGGVAGRSIYVSRPGVISPWAASLSVAGGEVWLRLPEYLRITDQNQSDPDVPLFRFIESIFSTANTVDLAWQDFRWVPPEQNGGAIKESGLVSPNAALPPALVWMAQVIGSVLLDPTTSYTPWSYLQRDPTPENVFSWTDWVNSLDKAPDDGDVTWNEIHDFDPAIFDLVSSFRQQVSGGFYGYRAGTTSSIIAAAKTVEGVNTVSVVPIYGGDPFAIQVKILTSEGGSAVNVERALVKSTPAGYQIVVSSV